MAPRTLQAKGATPPSDSPGQRSDAPRQSRGAPRDCHRFSLSFNVDLAAGAKTELTVGHDAFTGLEPAHDDGLGAQPRARLDLPALHRLVFLHHEDVGTLLPG